MISILKSLHLKYNTKIIYNHFFTSLILPIPLENDNFTVAIYLLKFCYAAFLVYAQYFFFLSIQQIFYLSLNNYILLHHQNGIWQIKWSLSGSAFSQNKLYNCKELMHRHSLLVTWPQYGMPIFSHRNLSWNKFCWCECLDKSQKLVCFK